MDTVPAQIAADLALTPRYGLSCIMQKSQHQQEQQSRHSGNGNSSAAAGGGTVLAIQPAQLTLVQHIPHTRSVPAPLHHILQQQARSSTASCKFCAVSTTPQTCQLTNAAAHKAAVTTD
jgi:hypothetical protein